MFLKRNSTGKVKSKKISTNEKKMQEHQQFLL